MSNKKSLSEETAMTLGMKHFLSSLDPIIHMAGSYEVLIDILKHLEETDKDFHKYILVKHLRQKIESSLGLLVDEEIKKFSLTVEDGLEILVSKITENIADSPEYVAFLQQINDSVTCSVDQLSQNVEDIHQLGHGNRKYSTLSDTSMGSSFNQDSIVFYSQQQFEKMAENIGPKKPLEMRLKAMTTLSRVPPVDIVSSEHWRSLKKSFLDSLADADEQLMEKSLRFHGKAFSSSVSNVSKEFYINMVEHLTSLFLSKKSMIPKLCDGLDLNQPDMSRLIKKFHLINQFQQTIPQLWVRYTDRYIQAIVDCTLSLLSVPAYLPSGSASLLTPLHFLALVDSKAKWSNQWMHGQYSRNIVIQGLDKNKILIEVSLRHCLLITRKKLKTQISKSNPVSGKQPVYKTQDLDYLLFIHSLHFIGQLLLYSQGRQFFPLKVNDDLEPITMKSFLEAMVSLLHDPTSSDLKRKGIGSFSPEFLVLEVLLQLTANEAACQLCLCHDTVIHSIMQPIKTILDKTEVSCASDVVLLQLAKVLKSLASSQCGLQILLYGEGHPRYIRNESSAANLIIEFCTQALIGQLLSRPDLKIITSFLKVCSLLLSSHEGFFILETKNMHLVLSQAWSLASQEYEISHTPTRSFNPDSSNQLIWPDDLLETLLSFTITPQGVFLLHSVNMLNQCMDYLYANHLSDLQSGRYEMFVTLSNVAATVPGTKAIHSSGLMQWIIKKVWETLECKEEDSWPCIPKSYSTGSLDKMSAEWLLTLLSIMSSYGAVRKFLPEQSVSKIDYSHRVIPDNFLALLERLVFIDSDVKKHSLFNYEQSNIFGLRLLSSLIFNLDFLLFFQSQYHFQEILLNEQARNVEQDSDDIIVDMLSVEINYILVKSYLIGGASEITLPPRTLNTARDGVFQWPLFKSFPLPDIYIDKKIHSKNTQNQDNVFQELNQFLEENSALNSEWLISSQLALKNVCLQCPTVVQEKVLFNLIVKTVVKSNKIVEDLTDSFTDQGKLSKLELLGITYTIQYGQLLNIIQNEEENTNNLKKLHFLLKQQICPSPDIDIEYPGYDWFASSIFLMSGCDLGKSLHLLKCLSNSTPAAYLWMTRLYNKFQIHPVFCALCHSVELILQTEVPLVFSAFKICRYSAAEICQQWIQQCFWNVLDWSEICLYIATCFVLGMDYQVYYCVAVLHHLQPRILKYAQNQHYLCFLKEEPIMGFQIGKYIQFMEFLQQKYHSIVMEYLLRYLK